MATVLTKPATLDDFLRAEAEAPEGMRLALIDGEIVEWGSSMTTRGPSHSRVMSMLSFLLWSWVRRHSPPLGVVDCGEVRCRLNRDPSEVVGIDVAFWRGAQFSTPPTNPPLYDAPPTLAVEILSPSDTHERVVDKVRLYLSRGVERVWLVDAELQTVTVCQRNCPPVSFNVKQTIKDDPALPSLELQVRELFDSCPSA